MDEQPIRNPHDALYRGVFADPRRAAELLRSVLPNDVIAAVDWSSLQRIDTSFVDGVLLPARRPWRHRRGGPAPPPLARAVPAAPVVPAATAAPWRRSDAAHDVAPRLLALLAVLGGRPIHNMLCSYVAAVRNDDLENAHAAYKRISKTSEKQFMTIAERLKQEGRLEGRQQGQREGRVATLLTLLEQRFGQLPAAVVQRVENATSAELEQWTLRLLTSATLSEMFA